ncbi:CPBP family intramembrane glutamic endopeptidase [Novosphingobium sp.]|uniref:CPBP family intramembrane glutamic endopeptidase n=1 Tax=Novosphingobium sp. TaxID=1874826 RepID=UPI002734951B|nr:CPBP family intramembrane glutamic endopeptidase [Novosphingobium sp.]MDP3908198.1 CPBP family intramembrane metalloprotease [Novosphingobium sp.]
MNEADALANLLGTGRRAAEPQPSAAVPAPPRALHASDPSAPAPALAPAIPGARAFWSWITLGLLACAGWILGSVTLLQAWLAQGKFGAGWSAGRVDLTGSMIVFGGLLGVSLLLMRMMPVASDRHRRMAVLPACALGLGLGAGGMMFSLLQAWLGNHVIVAPANAATTALASSLLVGAALIFFEAAVEEICFRGWLQRRLATRISPAAAVVLAAIAFSLLHIFGGARSPLALVNIFLAGVFFGVLAQRTGSIWAAIWAHFGWNWAETSLFGLSPNPGAPGFGAVFDLDLVGAPIWGGSAEGLNASVAITIVLVALLLPLLALRTRPE